MQVRANRDCVVDGLGKLTAGDWVDVTKKQEARFEAIHGKSLSEMESARVEVRANPPKVEKSKTTTKKKEDS